MVHYRNLGRSKITFHNHNFDCPKLRSTTVLLDVSEVTSGQWLENKMKIYIKSKRGLRSVVGK